MYTAKYESVFMYSVTKDYYILKKLLETILNKNIDTITLLNPNLIKDKTKNRNQKLDILVKCDEIYVNIEINSGYNKYIANRNLLYAFKVCNEFQEKGSIYKLKKQIIQINLNFNRNKYNEEYFIFDPTNKIRLTNILTIYNININFYVNKYYERDTEFISKYKYIIMLGLELDELENFSKEDDFVKKFTKRVKEVNEDVIIPWIEPEVERRMYEEMLREEAIKKGTRQGKRIGIKEGRKEGRKEGIKEGIKETTKNLLKLKVDLNTIIQATGLTQQEIENIKITIKN